MIEISKGATPLDLQKFLPEYSENQKCAAPLITALRAEQAAEIAFGRQLGEKSPPGGSLYNKGSNFKFMRFATVRNETGNARPGGKAYEIG